MKFKNLCALFLLLLASVYFICPVQCTAIQETGEATTADKVSRHHHQRVASQAADGMNQSTCCQSENQPSSPHEHQEEELGHCCFKQWDSLGTSEPQLASQIQKDTFSFVVLIPVTPKISSESAFFTCHFQPFYTPSPDHHIPQLSPRAPPFFLA